MFDYQISCSIGGRFVFRTEWMRKDEANRALSAMLNLRREGYKLTINRRDACMTCVDSQEGFLDLEPKLDALD